jgi:hypothetical protein
MSPPRVGDLVRERRWLLRQLAAALLSLAAVAVVSLAIWALEPHAPVVSLGVLYLFACCRSPRSGACRSRSRFRS